MGTGRVPDRFALMEQLLVSTTTKVNYEIQCSLIQVTKVLLGMLSISRWISN